MPERTCVACGKKEEKVRMYRISDDLELDRMQTQPGRGAYICTQKSCFNLLSRGKTTIRRSLRNSKIAKTDVTSLVEQLKYATTKSHQCDLTREFNG